MSNATGRDICRLGVLDYPRYSDGFVPIVERARLSQQPLEAIEEMRGFLANISDRERREEALTQLDRIEIAVSSARWHEAAAGHVLEAACVDNQNEIPDLMPTFDTWADILYDWDADHADAICNFFGFLADHTVDWASPSDIWRACIPPDVLEAPAAAMGALTPRQLRKLLTGAENGDVFSETEADVISDWWGEFRSMVRLARRQELGMMVAVRED